MVIVKKWGEILMTKHGSHNEQGNENDHNLDKDCKYQFPLIYLTFT